MEGDHVQRWLKCESAPGMFSDERTIIVRVKGIGSIEHFVPQALVQGNGADALVSVTVVRDHPGTWVELPTQYRRAIPVDEDQLVSA